MIKKSHRETLMDALAATERNCKMFFGWDKNEEVSVLLAANNESSDLNTAEVEEVWHAEKELSALKLKACIKYFMGAHKIEDGSPTAMRLEIMASEWIHSSRRDVVLWFEAAHDIYKRVFMGGAEWNDDNTKR